MRNKRRASFSVVAGVFAFAVGVARAQTPASPIALTWNAPAGCSDSETILKEVATLRGERAANEQMTAVATVALDANGVWSLQITTQFSDGTHGERQIQAESCKAAADVTASILALALTNRAEEIAAAASAAPAEPDAGAPPNENPTRPTEIPPPAEERDAGSENPESPPPKSPTTPAPLHIHFGANIGATLGDFPTAGLGGGGDFGVTYRAFRGEAYANYWALGRSEVSGGAANFQMFSVGARTCASFGASWTLGPCAAFELGTMRAESVGVTSPSAGSALSADGFLGALGTVPLDKNRLISLRALLEIGAAFQRPTFVLDGASFAYQPGPVVGRGSFGVEIRF